MVWASRNLHGLVEALGLLRRRAGPGHGGGPAAGRRGVVGPSVGGAAEGGVCGGAESNGEEDLPSGRGSAVVSTSRGSRPRDRWWARLRARSGSCAWRHRPSGGWRRGLAASRYDGLSGSSAWVASQGQVRSAWAAWSRRRGVRHGLRRLPAVERRRTAGPTVGRLRVTSRAWLGHGHARPVAGRAGRWRAGGCGCAGGGAGGRRPPIRPGRGRRRRGAAAWAGQRWVRQRSCSA